MGQTFIEYLFRIRCDRKHTLDGVQVGDVVKCIKRDSGDYSINSGVEYILRCDQGDTIAVRCTRNWIRGDYRKDNFVISRICSPEERKENLLKDDSYNTMIIRCNTCNDSKKVFSFLQQDKINGTVCNNCHLGKYEVAGEWDVPDVTYFDY